MYYIAKSDNSMKVEFGKNMSENKNMEEVHMVSKVGCAMVTAMGATPVSYTHLASSR